MAKSDLSESLLQLGSGRTKEFLLSTDGISLISDEIFKENEDLDKKQVLPYHFEGIKYFYALDVTYPLEIVIKTKSENRSIKVTSFQQLYLEIIMTDIKSQQGNYSYSIGGLKYGDLWSDPGIYDVIYTYQLPREELELLTVEQLRLLISYYDVDSIEDNLNGVSIFKWI